MGGLSHQKRALMMNLKEGKVIALKLFTGNSSQVRMTTWKKFIWKHESDGKD